MDVREQSTESTPNTPLSGDVKPHFTGTGTGSRSLESSSKDWECYLSKDDRLVSSQACGKPPSRSRTEIEILGVIDDGSAYTTSRPIAETKPWYLHADYEEGKDIIIDSDGTVCIFPSSLSVRAGSVTALVEYLTSHEVTDTRFTASFLMTFKSFSDIDTVVGLLIERFWIKSPDGLSNEEWEEWKTMKQHIIRTRVLMVFETIIVDDDVLEERDMHVVDRLTEFVQDDEVQNLEAGQHLLAQIESAQNRGIARTTTISYDPQPPPIVPCPKEKPKLLEFDPLEVARQLTIIECELFLKIKYLTMEWSRESASGPSNTISAVIQTSNKIAHWVADAVLEKEGARKRGLVVKYFITVADRCRELHNFSSMVAIVSGLNAPPVRRLKRTWDEISQKYAGILSTCEVTIDSGRNFSNYRQLLQSVTPPCVPFIGVYLTTLTSIQNEEPHTISGSLVNFRKCAKVAEVIQEAKKWQSKPFNFARVEPIADHLHERLHKFNDVPNVSDAFWKRSLEREPGEHPPARDWLPARPLASLFQRTVNRPPGIALNVVVSEHVETLSSQLL
ncbi:ras GEF [Peniophora sp. CONT]|nr:ras GEF [Peniophora sp. CONT]